LLLKCSTLVLYLLSEQSEESGGSGKQGAPADQGEEANPPVIYSIKIT
jgi:hypothetical protein